MPLTDILIKKIKNDGPLSFHDFMEMALYYPEGGYYAGGSERIREKNDPQSGPEFSEVFGLLLAKQLEEMWKLTGSYYFTIIEYGAGNGSLCHEILSYFRRQPELYERLRYCIIEKSPAMIRKEKKLLCEKAEWYDSIGDIFFEVGCILSNEVLTNFAVHEVVMQKDLMEVYIDYQDGFKEILFPASHELKEYLKEQNVVLPAGYRTEINLEALTWLEKNAVALQKGFLVTIDYGFPAQEFFSLSRHKGNLGCYQKQATDGSLYHAIGEQDINSHVNFSALHHWGNRFGLSCCGFTSQAHFLHGLGLVPLLDTITAKGSACKERLIQLYRKVMCLSNRFNILVQQKGLEVPPLSGLHFAKPVV
ncbi:MAG: SAM-dependent methyltransferase [Sediminibacterium sp.]